MPRPPLTRFAAMRGRNDVGSSSVLRGQPADKVARFDVQAFFRRLGLEQNLSMGRRNGLADMVRRIQDYAAAMAK